MACNFMKIQLACSLLLLPFYTSRCLFVIPGRCNYLQSRMSKERALGCVSSSAAQEGVGERESRNLGVRAPLARPALFVGRSRHHKIMSLFDPVFQTGSSP